MPEVLIADDSAIMRDLLRDMLAEDHTVVGEVEDGVAAVETYAEVDPDVVLMDAVMPVQDGIEATDEIKTRNPGATVILCANVGQESEVRAAGQGSADGYLRKPFRKPSVIDVIDDVVGA